MLYDCKERLEGAKMSGVEGCKFLGIKSQDIGTAFKGVTFSEKIKKINFGITEGSVQAR